MQRAAEPMSGARLLAAALSFFAGLALIASTLVFSNPQFTGTALFRSLGTDNPSALSRLATLRFAEEDYAAANAAARASLRSAPFDQRSLTISALTDPRAERRDRGVNLAAALGWRDPATQILLAGLSLEGGQPEMFVQRIGALATMDEWSPTLVALYDLGLEDPDARAGVTQTLAREGAVQRAFWGAAPTRSTSLKRRADALRVVAPGMAPDLRRETAATLIARMRVEPGGDALAFGVWRTLVRKPKGNEIAGGRLRLPLAASPTPYDWQQPARSAVALSNYGEAGIEITPFVTQASAVITRELPSQPARYRLLAIPAENGSAAGLRWDARCLDRQLDVLPSTTTGEAISARVTIPADCRRPNVTLQIGRNAARIALDRLAIERAE